MMRNLLFAITMLLLFTTCQTPSILFENAICIENVTTIDAVNGLQTNQTVVIQDHKIIQVKPSSEVNLSPDNEIIDGSGKFLIPGLWDAHMHFAYLEDMAPYMFDLFLAYGITSIRDTGGKIEFVKKWKDKATANPTEAPRVMIAGPLLDGIPNVYDGSDQGHPPLSVGISSIEEGIRKVDYLDSMGVDLIKAYEMLPPEIFKAIVDRAHQKGLKVTGHIPLSMDAIQASNGGMNSMEHMRNIEISCAGNAADLLAQRQQLLEDGRKDPGGILRSRIHQAQREFAIENYDANQAQRVIGVLAKNQTWQIPTITLNTAFSERPFLQQDWQATFKYLPAHLEEQWLQRSKAMGKMEITNFRKEYSKWLLNMVDQLHQADIPIMAGTDCPIFFLTPGLSLHEELAVLVKAGLSPLEVLKTATLNPAIYFGLEKELGLIQEGMFADLVLLNANPLEDITNSKQIEGVFKNGKFHDRENLNQRLAKLDQGL